MSEDWITCSICWIQYDNVSVIPVKIPCCNKIFCRACLEDIYKRKDSIIKCPICRTESSINPSELPAEVGLFETFWKCFSCKQQVLKEEIFFDLTLNALKCVNCKDDNAMVLTDYLSFIMDDLNGFVEEFNNKADWKIIIQNAINERINLIFDPIKENLKVMLLDKVLNEIRSKFEFDIQKEWEEFNRKLSYLNTTYLNINKYMKAGESESKEAIIGLLNHIEEYTKNIDTIREACPKYDSIIKLVQGNNLIMIKDYIHDKEIEYFFSNILETFWENHTPNAYLTGIKYYDDLILKGVNVKYQEDGNISDVNERNNTIHFQ